MFNFFFLRHTENKDIERAKTKCPNLSTQGHRKGHNSVKNTMTVAFLSSTGSQFDSEYTQVHVQRK